MTTVFSVLATVAFAAAVAVLVRRHLIFVTRVESWSMWPTLRPGQRVATLILHRAERLARGDVVAIDSHEIGHTLVKRVAGVGGDRVDIGGGRSQVVPAGHVFLLGDNPAHSHDSRTWAQPFLPVSAIRGRLVGQRSRAAARNVCSSRISTSRPGPSFRVPAACNDARRRLKVSAVVPR